MVIDLAQNRPELSATVFDVCIVGGGVAGIILAVKLGQAGRRVLITEAGDRTSSAESQSYYRGERGSFENLALDETRVRALGGSSQHWGGWCRTLDAYDFARSDLAADGEWPISKEDLDPYFSDAIAMLGVTESNGEDAGLADADGNLQTIRMYFSKPPANLGSTYFNALQQSNNITLLLNAPYLSAAFDVDQVAINSITIHDRHSPEPLICRARCFVFTMGAIENVRHLLILKRTNPDRLNNIGKNLGRYYMQHLHQELGQFVILQGNGAPVFAQHVLAFMASTEKYLRSHGRGTFRLYSASLSSCVDLIDQFRNVVTGASCHGPASAGIVSITSEQLPNANSQILLTDKNDELGLPRTKLDWRVSDDDFIAMREAALEFGRYLIYANIGRLKVNPVISDSPNPLYGWTTLAGAHGAAGHQMGGARMSKGAVDGIVDKDCRVWDINNLYVAGSAVFRTSGHATPTLTIAQLALRLADSLNRRLDG